MPLCVYCLSVSLCVYMYVCVCVLCLRDVCLCVCVCNWSADSQLEFKYIDSQGDKISFIGLLALNLATHYYINRGLHISMYMHIYVCMYVCCIYVWYIYGIYN